MEFTFFLRRLHFTFPKFLCSLGFVSEAVRIHVLSDGIWVTIPTKGDQTPWVDGQLTPPEPPLSSHHSDRLPSWPGPSCFSSSLPKSEAWTLRFLLAGYQS